MKGRNARGRWSTKVQAQRLRLFQGWKQVLWELPPPRSLTVSISFLERAVHGGWVYGRGRSAQRLDPGVLGVATGTPGWQCTGVGQSLFPTWSGPSFLGDSGRSLGSASRAGWLIQDLSAVQRDCSGLADCGLRGRACQRRTLGLWQWQKGLVGASSCWVGWGFKEGQCGSAPSSVGKDHWDW